MNTKIKVAEYCRVSTDMEDQLHSLSAQIQYFTDYISQHDGWELVEVYYDMQTQDLIQKQRLENVENRGFSEL